MVDALSRPDSLLQPQSLQLLPSVPTSESNFEKVFQEAGKKINDAKQTNPTQLEKAAKQMEIQMLTFMFKTMEKSGTENGLLGDSKSEGMSHFKDLFFQSVAEEMVKTRGLGLAESIVKTSKPNNLMT